MVKRNLEKIILTTTCLLWAGVSFGACQNTTCANGKGTVIEGEDHASCYCQSKVAMNWWSAFAWCDTAGGRLVDINTDCDTVAGTTDCPNLPNTSNSWTRNTCHGKAAYFLNRGALGCSDTTSASFKTYHHYALCRGNY